MSPSGYTTTMGYIRIRSAAARPLDYPGKAPASSWLLNGNHVAWLTSLPDNFHEWSAARYAVLAIGSNRRPGRLAEHLVDCSSRTVMGLQVRITGADIVYPSHVSTYGITTATILPEPEAIISGWLLFLDATQLVYLS